MDHQKYHITNKINTPNQVVSAMRTRDLRIHWMVLLGQETTPTKQLPNSY